VMNRLNVQRPLRHLGKLKPVKIPPAAPPAPNAATATARRVIDSARIPAALRVAHHHGMPGDLGPGPAVDTRETRPSYSRFELRRQYVGVVREVERERGVFQAILREPGTSKRHVTWIHLDELIPADRDRLKPGMSFYWVLGYLDELNAAGEVRDRRTDSSFLVRSPQPPLPAAEQAAAKDEADRLFATHGSE
jgi:hypothetical protein